MDLEKKTFLIILATLIVVAGLSAVVADRLVLESFRTLERGEATEELGRVQQAVADSVADLDHTAQDWAHWDDAYQFVQDNNSHFADSNLVPNSFAANGLAVMVFLDSHGHTVFAAAYDPATGNLTAVPERFSRITSNGPLMAHPDDDSSVAGLFVADGVTYEVSSWPILTSTEQGPPAGTLVWARLFDVGALASHTRLPLVLEPWTPAAPAPGGIKVRATSSSTLQGQVSLADIQGQPVGVLTAHLDRPVYRQGLNTMAYVFASAILIGGGLLVAMIVLLNTTVLARLTRLTRGVEGLGDDPHARVEVSGTDEITRLSSEFNHLLDRLDRHQSSLESSNADLRQFAAVVSHDLQPPLSTVALNAAVLREHSRGKLDSDAHDRLDRIESTALRMAAHIRAILDYSRVSFEPAHVETVDLQEAFAEVSRNLEERLHATRGKLECGPLPTIDGHPTQMVQLLQNLSANALKFHRPGIAPVVRVTSKDLGDGRVRITVEDNGEGFGPADFERMRKPYIRLPGRGQEGHGLGLATCDRIVERHHGRMWAESVPGQGSKVHVDLPSKQ
jgi:signal transduction histidine kinase